MSEPCDYFSGLNLSSLISNLTFPSEGTVPCVTSQKFILVCPWAWLLLWMDGWMAVAQADVYRVSLLLLP